jgi:DNA-binding response OmpR family regulator
METVDILVVEDNPADARLVVEVFNEFNVKTKINIVEDGIKAMDYLYKRNKYKDYKTPSLIILDLNLPKKNGREVLKEIKNDNKLKLIPVIVLTTSRDDRDICESYEYCANAYIAKPTDFEEFVKVIRTFEDFWFNTARLPRVDGKID